MHQIPMPYGGLGPFPNPMMPFMGAVPQALPPFMGAGHPMNMNYGAVAYAAAAPIAQVLPGVNQAVPILNAVSMLPTLCDLCRGIAQLFRNLFSRPQQLLPPVAAMGRGPFPPAPPGGGFPNAFPHRMTPSPLPDFGQGHLVAAYLPTPPLPPAGFLPISLPLPPQTDPPTVVFPLTPFSPVVSPVYPFVAATPTPLPSQPAPVNPLIVPASFIAPHEVAKPLFTGVLPSPTPPPIPGTPPTHRTPPLWRSPTPHTLAVRGMLRRTSTPYSDASPLMQTQTQAQVTCIPSAPTTRTTSRGAACGVYALEGWEHPNPDDPNDWN